MKANQYIPWFHLSTYKASAVAMKRIIPTLSSHPRHPPSWLQFRFVWVFFPILSYLNFCITYCIFWFTIQAGYTNWPHDHFATHRVESDDKVLKAAMTLSHRSHLPWSHLTSLYSHEQIEKGHYGDCSSAAAQVYWLFKVSCLISQSCLWTM